MTKTMWTRRSLCGLRPRRLAFVFLAAGTVYFMASLMRVKTYNHKTPSNGQQWMPLKVTDFMMTAQFRNVTSTTAAQMTGFERAAFLREDCQRLSDQHLPGGLPGGYDRYTNDRVRVSYNRHYNAMYCPLCKMASTFWTRVFIMLEKNRKSSTHLFAITPVLETNNSIPNDVLAKGGVALLSNASPPAAKTPFDIPINDAPPSKQHFVISRQLLTPQSYDAKSAFKFLFVRSPYTLLFSTYVDKLVGPNPSMWKLFGNRGSERVNGGKSRDCGQNISFQDFVAYVTRTYMMKHAADCHVEKVTACSPCKANYSFVGQMETFKTDTFQILTKLGQTETVEIFKSQFSDLHALDAIEDSVSGPYSWKKDILQCISWPNALRRIWRKLQIRGVLGAMPFPLTDEEANNITKSEFMKLANKARGQTTSSEKRTLKKEAFAEAYSTLSDDVLDNVHRVYHEEFFLFGYERLDPISIREDASRNKFKDFLNYAKDLTLR